MVAIEQVVLVVAVLVVVVAVAVVVWWRWAHTEKEKEPQCPEQPRSLFSARIMDLEARLELVKETMRCLRL